MNSKSILESIKLKPFLIFLSLLVFALLIIGYQCGITKEAKRTAKILIVKAEEAEKEFDRMAYRKEIENRELEWQNLQLDRIIIEKKTENERLVERGKEDAVEMKKLKEEIAKEAPNELIVRSRSLLNTDEIWWNKDSERVELSLSVFRIGVTRWADWGNFIYKREPDYKKQIGNLNVVVETQAGKIFNLYGEISNFKLVMIAKENSYDILSDAFKDYRKYVSKKGGWLRDALVASAGYGFGKIIEGFSKK